MTTDVIPFPGPQPRKYEAALRTARELLLRRWFAELSSEGKSTCLDFLRELVREEKRARRRPKGGVR